MKCFSKLSLLIFSISFFCLRISFAQDLTAFEVMDNESVGLTVAPFEKYGMAVSDIDRNGYPDIFCLRWHSPGYSRIYINDGGNFQDITDQSPLEEFESQAGNTRTTLWVDYDNDGDRDLSVSTSKSIHLLRNDNNIFTEVSDELGFVGQIPPGFISNWEFHIGGWADYDLDGDLDCVVGQWNNDNLYLFRNDGDHFTDVATEAGLDSLVSSVGNIDDQVGNCRLTWIDIDFDGDPDLYSYNQVFRNDNGVFTDITEPIGLNLVDDIGWREFFDYDNDGDFDYFRAVMWPNSPATNELWENQNGVFVNVTEDVGLTLSRDRYRGMTIGDFDNDGDEDIFLNLNIDASLDVLLVNEEVAPGERAFEDVAEFVGITQTGDRKGAVFFDYDRDGFLDIYSPSAEHNHILYHNLAINEANWIGFILEGTLSNRDAVGSLMTIYAGDKKQIRYTTCGNGFLRQDNPWVHFGIGFDTSVDSVVIRWPLGYKQILTDVAINQYHEIKEPDYSSVASGEVNSTNPLDFSLDQNYPNPFNSSTRIGFNLNKADHVSLIIYDMTGREIIDLVNEKRETGFHSVKWNGRDAKGVAVSTGVYVCKIQVQNQIQNKKIVLIK
jgi:hypothetical protein